MELIITKKIIPSTDPRLGRHINFDSRSVGFTFDATGITIKDAFHQRLIDILNQLQLGSCTGNGGIGNINTSPFSLNTKVYTPDEAGAVNLYSDAEKIDGGAGYPPEDAGSSGLSIAKALLNAGLISNYYHCFTLEQTLAALTQFPILFGSNWYADMFNPDPDGRVHITGNLAGGHEYLGRQSNIENGQIWWDNSWGEDWGVAGRFYLTFEDFATLLSQNGDAIVLIPPLLKLGSKGQAVKNLQTNLNKKGYNLLVDGIFGPVTKKFVCDFQNKNGLVVDGIVGRQTLVALNN